MRQLRKFVLTALAAVCWAGPGAVLAKATAQEADRLGKDLTPVGAEKAGNRDGSIPSWEGGLNQAPAGFQTGSGHYPDPFAAEKPLYTITAQNVAQYRDRLTAAQLAMFQKHPGFRMHVYPSHRTAAYPAEVYDGARKAATTSELKGGGNGVHNPTGAWVPFPVPKSAQEVMWNHTMRWRGGGADRTYVWFPVQANGSSYKVGYRELFITDQNTDQHKDNRLFNYLGWYTSPPTLEGTVYLLWEPVDQVAEQRSAWIYNSGQRRVRRVPELAYDYVADGVEGMRTTDQVDGFNGAQDRYEWKLLGKKEIYIPYNAYRLVDKKVKYADIVKPGHINQDYARYELHRVWVVEATLKPGARHIYGKRTFYLDEDTWQVAIEDSYDTRGELWRYHEGHAIHYYDALVSWYAANIWYDLNSGAYLIHNLVNEEKIPVRFGVRARLADFQPDNLRRLGTK